MPIGQVESSRFLIDSAVPGARMALRHKWCGAKPAGRTVLMVHGATYASTLVFDYPAGGESWMDVLARAGFDVWCVDLPGYGAAERPAQMNLPAQDHPPLVRTVDAEGCVSLAMDFVLANRRIDRLSLIGYSWGTAVCGAVAGVRPSRVERLVLLGALWLKDGPSAIAGSGPPGAWRLVDADGAASRWVIGLTSAQADAVASTADRSAWVQSTLDSDADDDPARTGTLRAPAGVVADVMEYWSAGRPTYDPGLVEAPTLIVVGEWDHETTPEQGRAVFDRLVRARDRRYVLVGRATHSMPLERQRGVLHRTVNAFLAEGDD